MINTSNLITALILYIVLAVSLWVIFNKAGESGWKAIIPVYNMYTAFKLFWKKSMFWVVLILSVAVMGLMTYATYDFWKSTDEVAQKMGYSDYEELYEGVSAGDVSIYDVVSEANELGNDDTDFSTIVDMSLFGLSGIISIILLILEIIFYHKMSKSFGHGIGYTLGLIFLQPIFMLMLAFGKSQYTKRQGA